jgi:hypothetical protein
MDHEPDEAPTEHDDLLGGGPPAAILGRILGARGGDGPRLGRMAALVVAIGWAPLVLFSAAQALAFDQPGLRAFVADIAVHARSLVAAPLLVLADALCAPRLGGIVRHFVDAGLVLPGQRPPFDEAVASTRRWLRSPATHASLILLAYALCATFVITAPPGRYPAWQFGEHEAGGLGTLVRDGTMAGIWHLVVSLPILLALILGWIWRVLLWTRLAWKLSRMKLRLVAAHPDLSAGLRFVGTSARAFVMVAFALGLVVAGTLANRVVHEGASVLAFKYVIGATAILTLAIFLAPLLAFVPTLLEVRRRGIFDYGAFGDELGRDLEDTWLHDPAAVRARGLTAQDFSAVNDGFQIVANAYALRVVPFDKSGAVALAVAVLLPFVPVLMASLPMATVAETVAKLFF